MKTSACFTIVRRFALFVVPLVPVWLLLASAAAQSPAQPAPVSVTFGNNTAADVNLVFMKRDKSLSPPTLLKAGQQVSAGKSYPGQVWLVQGADGKSILAQYSVDSTPVQNVGLKSLIAYQTPCTVVFQNDLSPTGDDDFQLDVLWRHIDGTEENYCHPLEPNKQYSNGDTLPGHVWRVRYKGELLGEYTVRPTTDKNGDGEGDRQVVSIAALRKAYQAHVSLTFSNSTSGPVSIFWLNGDQPVLYAPKLPAGKAYVQTAQAGSIWIVKDGSGQDLGRYSATQDKGQNVDVAKLSR